MSGTVSFSMQQQFDEFGELLIGGLVYSFASGTTTAQNAFRDGSLTSPFPNPITLDASGRVPQLFFADGTIRIRITDASGVVQIDADALPVLGSSSSGTTAAPTDPNAILNTGDLKARYGTGSLAGYVRCNGNTIGNAGSGATERANIDTQSLFSYLWNLNDADLVVSPSRGASATADFSSTTPFKTIKLPDFAGMLIGVLDDMGGGVKGRLSNWASVPNNTKTAVTLGAAAGADNFLLSISNMPSHVHAAFIFDPQHSHTVSQNAALNTTVGAAFGAQAAAAATPATVVVNPAATGVQVWDGATLNQTAAQGGNAIKPTLPPMRLITLYMRL